MNFAIPLQFDYPRGTRVRAECTEYDVTGTLAVDHVDLDGIVSIWDEDTQDIVRLRGWLWSIEVEPKA
jgi:hypothetical protein